MIYLELTGGLGNQMFQYAYGKALSKKFCKDIAYIDRSYKTDELRQLAVNRFCVTMTAASQRSEYDFFKKYKIRSFIHKVIEKCYRQTKMEKQNIEYTPRRFKFKQRILNFFGIFYNTSQRYSKIYFSAFSEIYANGLWHYPEYFADFREELCREFVLRETLSEPNAFLKKRIQESESVIVHIRRGDYLTVPGYYVCNEYYYNNCIKQAETQLQNPVFYIFSDDIEWARTALSSTSEMVFVDHQNPDYIDMELMRHGKHFVISNSTFSWWAQYLGCAPQKQVYAPDRWYNDGQTKKVIYQKEWNIVRTVPKGQ